jgi:hypothetical protein
MDEVQDKVLFSLAYILPALAASCPWRVSMKRLWGAPFLHPAFSWVSRGLHRAPQVGVGDIGYVKSRDAFRNKMTSGSAWTAAAVMGDKTPRAARVMPRRLKRTLAPMFS